MTVRVVVADDQALLRGSFRLLLDSADGLECVGEAADGDQAVRVAVRERPDVVLMDVRMPGTDGLEATRRICADPRLPGTRVLVLTTYDLDEYVFAALHAGASGYLLKDVEPARLLEAVRLVAAGEALLAPAVTGRLIAEFVRRAAPSRCEPAGPAGPASGLPPGRLDAVTPREREVLALIAAGLSNTEIARRLALGAATVKTHVSRLLLKTGARDRAQLVIAAYESGLVRAGGGPPTG